MKELVKHCRQSGVEDTIKAIEQLLLSLSSATDTLRVPLSRRRSTPSGVSKKNISAAFRTLLVSPCILLLVT